MEYIIYHNVIIFILIDSLHTRLPNYECNMMHLWFDGGYLPKVLIDNADLSHSEEFDNDYEKDFAINAE